MSDHLKLSMYMDQDTAARYFTVVSCGIDNNSFEGYFVPFALHSDGEKIALKKFARDHTARHVVGPPRYLLTITIPAHHAVQYFLDRSIKVLENRQEATVAFTKPINLYNYPAMIMGFVRFDEPENLLKSGNELLNASE